MKQSARDSWRDVYIVQRTLDSTNILHEAGCQSLTSLVLLLKQLESHLATPSGIRTNYSIATISTPIRLKYNLVRTDSISLQPARLHASPKLQEFAPYLLRFVLLL